MTITRALISDDGQTITWDVQRDSVSIGTSTELSPTHPSITRLANETAMRQAASTALAANRDYLALAPATTAQALAQVKALTRQTNGLMRLLLRQLDDVSDA